MLVGREPLRVISKTRLVLDSLDRSLRNIFRAIHANQKFSVLANLALEPE